MRSFKLLSSFLIVIVTIMVVAVSGSDQSQDSKKTATLSSAAGGVDLSGMDRSIKPGDNFYAYANGAWINATEIPSDRSSFGLDEEMTEEVNVRTQGLLLEVAKSSAPAGSIERKIGDYFAAYMDEAAIESRGLSALRGRLDQIATISDRRALAAALGETMRADVDPLNSTNFHTSHLLGVWVAQDFNHPDRNAPYLLQGGLGMPDRDYYLDPSPRMVAIREKYKAHIATVLRLAGMDESKAEGIFALETKIAKTHATITDSADVQKANNPWRQADFIQKAPGMDWDAFFRAAGLAGQPLCMVWQPGAFIGESALVASEPLEVWKDYLAYQSIDEWSSLLPKAFVEERFAFYGQVLTGTPKLRERWKRAVNSCNAALGDAIGQIYVKRYFPPEAKTKAEAMVADLVRAFGRRIDTLVWMSPSTKSKAKEKLATLKVGVGYPDQWRDYSGLEISRSKALQNALQAEHYKYRQELAKLGQPANRSEWWMLPQTVNAVNLPIQNALNFPAAILQPPYFDPRADAANNYGAIGSVIGHEISHSFDDQGCQFDATGRLANWWTPEDHDHFKAASARLVEQYNLYRPFPDLALNGQQTLSENIADVAGLAVAYDAYRLSLGGKHAVLRQGLTGEQQFFISFAQSWRTKFREPLLRQIIILDGHAPAEYRVDTVRNLDAWYDAFQVKPGDALYLAPKDRIRLW